MDEYDEAFLEELGQAGSISCRLCREEIRFVRRVGLTKIIHDGGIKWECNMCGELICDVSKEELLDKKMFGTIGEHIDRIEDTVTNINSEEELESIRAQLERIDESWRR